MIRLALGFAAALFAATSALAGPFVGTWKADMSTWKASTKPYTRLLANGHYHCTCSKPPEDFPADGMFHKVVGHADYDEAEASVVDAASVHFAYKLKGVQNFEVTTTSSSDGMTAHEKWIDTSVPKTTTGEGEEVRVGPAPKGAHAISGVWHDSDKASVSDQGLSVTMTQTGNTLTTNASDGTGFTAESGGPFVHLEGTNLGTEVAIAFRGPSTLVETFKQGGKLVDRDVWTVSPDGKTMHGVFTNLLSGRSESLTSVKQ